MLKVNDWYYRNCGKYYELGRVINIYDNSNYCDIEHFVVTDSGVDHSFTFEVDSVFIERHKDNSRKPSDTFLTLYRKYNTVDQYLDSVYSSAISSDD